jgi:thiamine-monophosphate kinase
MKRICIYERGLQMRIREMGERKFISSIRDLVKLVEGARLSFDEDASDIPLDDRTDLVVNVDTFVKSTDWLPGMTAKQAGRKTAVMTLSDLAAKGVQPIASLLSVCVPNDTEAVEVRDIVSGFSHFVSKARVPYIGGDMGSSKDIVLTGVAFGITPPDRVITRGGANVNDIIATTGPFGLTTLAFRMLIDSLEVSELLKGDVLKAAYEPTIHLGFISGLSEKESVSASMDSSDGLGITLNTMAAQCESCFVIERLPCTKTVTEFAEKKGIDLLDLVMRGGEEFELVLTIPKEKWDSASRIAADQKVELTPIGRVKEGSGVLWQSKEGVIPVLPAGYDNFREWE